MAWNPSRILFASLATSLVVACLGCESAKKPDSSRKDKAVSSKEASSPDSSAKEDKQATSDRSEKTMGTAEPADNTAGSSAETSAKTEGANPSPVSEAKAGDLGAHKSGKPVKKEKTVKQQIPPPATIKKVSLTDKLRATCLVNVGDELPQGDLTDQDGKPVALKDLYGETLTVVCFWNTGTTAFTRQSATELLGDMQLEVSDPFSTMGVKVVGVNVGDNAENIKDILQKSGSNFSLLFDSKGEYFKSVATEKLPREYLLDDKGKILWFDVEYGRTTRRELLSGIRAVLEGKK